MSAASEPVLIPVGRIGLRLDNDSPTYVFAPDLYLTLALAYDSMAAPAAARDADGVWEPDYRRMQPRLATAWAEEADGSWIVTLREGVLSHAGEEWTASDVVWTFERAFAQGVMACWRWRDVVGVQAVEALDRHRVRFRLRAPYPTFPNWLVSVSPNMVDATTLANAAAPADPWALGWLDNNVAGFGAYRLGEFTPDVVRFHGRPEHWQGLPDAHEIEVRRWGDRADAISQLAEPRPVIAVGLDPDEAVAALGQSELRVVRAWAGHISVEIDFTVAPFDDPRVRKALAHATPAEQLRERALHGLARPWASPVKRVSQWYRETPVPAYDVRAARRLLSEAGLGGGFETELYVTSQPYVIRMAELIVEAWASVGVEVALRDAGATPEGWLPPLFLRSECAHNLSEPIYDVVHDYAAMNPLLPLPGGPANVGNWRPRWRKNPRIIERLVEMLMHGDASEKRALFDRLQAEIVEFGSSIFIGEMQQVTAANAQVPASLLAPDSRFFHALHLQNATTAYLPPHRSAR